MSDEVFQLLSHPSPVERKMALKHPDVGREHLAYAVLDPAESVWKAALRHPKTDNHVLMSLAVADSPRGGGSMVDRHHAMLGHPHTHRDHLKVIYDHHRNRGTAPEEFARIAQAIHDHPHAAYGLKCDIVSDLGLNKAVHNDDFMPLRSASIDETGKIGRLNGVEHLSLEHETNAHPAAHNPYAHAYMSQIHDSPQVVRANGDLGRGISPKTVYRDVNVNGTPTDFLVKPYFETPESNSDLPGHGFMHHPLAGWAEMTNQHIYHAAGMGDRTQKAFVVNHQIPGHQSYPAVVIPMQRGAVDIEDFNKTTSPGDWNARTPEQHTLFQNAANDGYRKSVLDFLTGNEDNHIGNLLVDPKTGHMLSIDHGRSFQYKAGAKNGMPVALLSSYMSPYMATYGDMYDTPGSHEQRVANTAKWWDGARDKIRNAFHERLTTLDTPWLHNHLRANFEKRVSALDDWSNRVKNGDYYHDAETSMDHSHIPSGHVSVYRGDKGPVSLFTHPDFYGASPGSKKLNTGTGSIHTATGTAQDVRSIGTGDLPGIPRPASHTSTGMAQTNVGGNTALGDTRRIAPVKKALDAKVAGRLLTNPNTVSPARAALVQGSHSSNLNNHPESHNALAQHFNDTILNSPEVITPSRSKITHIGAFQKHVYKTPGGHKFIVKPYYSEIDATIPRGWAEKASQSVYHAVGLGDLHQKSHTFEHQPTGSGKMAGTAIWVDPKAVSYENVHDDAGNLSKITPDTEHKLSQIQVMDFLFNNIDRYTGNLMYNPSTRSPLAIDNEYAFSSYRVPPERVGTKEELASGSFTFDHAAAQLREKARAFRAIGGEPYTENHDFDPKAIEWLRGAAPTIRNEVARNTAMLVDPETKNNISRNLEYRLNYLLSKRPG